MTKTFEIWDFFRNELFGSSILFYIFSILFLVFGCMKFKIPEKVLVILFIIYTLVFFSFAKILIIPILGVLLLITYIAIKAYDREFFQSK